MLMGIGTLTQCHLLFRSVYDGEEHGRFMEKLEARIRNHDREIEKMCNFHYQGFVDSITELLKVRGEAQKLKVRESHLNPMALGWTRRPLEVPDNISHSVIDQKNVSFCPEHLSSVWKKQKQTPAIFIVSSCNDRLVI